MATNNRMQRLVMPFKETKSHTTSIREEREDFLAPSQDRIRLLRPSFALYFVVAGAFSLITALIGTLYTNIDTILFVAWVFGISPAVIAPFVAKAIASVAEQKRYQPNFWFSPDVKREKRRYEPLRSHRLFGHKLGRGSGVDTGRAPLNNTPERSSDKQAP